MHDHLNDQLKITFSGSIEDLRTKLAGSLAACDAELERFETWAQRVTLLQEFAASLHERKLRATSLGHTTLSDAIDRTLTAVFAELGNHPPLSGGIDSTIATSQEAIPPAPAAEATAQAADAPPSQTAPAPAASPAQTTPPASNGVPTNQVVMDRAETRRQAEQEARARRKAVKAAKEEAQRQKALEREEQRLKEQRADTFTKLDALESFINDLQLRCQLAEPDIDLLHAEIEMFVADTNILQQCAAKILVGEEWQDFDRRSNELFKPVRYLCERYLKPNSRFVQGLKRDESHDFERIRREASRRFTAHTTEKERQKKARQLSPEQITNWKNQVAQCNAALTDLLTEPAAEDQDWIGRLQSVFRQLENHKNHEYAVRSNEAVYAPEIVALLEPLLGELEPYVPKALRKKVKRSGRFEAVSSDDLDESTLADNEADAPSHREKQHWETRNTMRGMRGLVLGGDRMAKNVERLKTHFGFEELEWPDMPQDGNNQYPRQISHIQSGKYDVVFFNLKYGRHRIGDEFSPVCKEAGIPFLKLLKGYGIANFHTLIMETFPDRLNETPEAALDGLPDDSDLVDEDYNDADYAFDHATKTNDE